MYTMYKKLCKTFEALFFQLYAQGIPCPMQQGGLVDGKLNSGRKLGFLKTYLKET